MLRRRLPQVNLVKTFQKYASNNAFFYVTLDPERALGLEDVLPNYTIICPYKSQLTERLHQRVLVLEEHLSPQEVCKIVERGTYGILCSDFVQKYIHANVGFRKSHIMVLKNSQLIENLCKKQNWNLLAPKAKIAEKFENKISQYKLLKNIVAYPSSFVTTLGKIYSTGWSTSHFRSTQGGDPYNPPIKKINDSPLKSRKRLILQPSFFCGAGVKKYVLQFNRGHSGNSTFFIKTKKELETLAKKFPKREAKISQYIKGKTYTLNCLALKSGEVITGSLSEQITGLASATNNPNTTCGNDFTSPRKLVNARIKEIQTIVQNTGAALRKKGYRGLFGIDVIIEKATGNVYFLEANTHQPASISFEAKLHRRIGEVPLLAYFILDSIQEKNVGGRISHIKPRKVDLPSLVLPISAKQILYRNKTSKILRSDDIVKKYRREGLVSRMKFVKPNEEIYRIQHGL